MGNVFQLKVQPVQSGDGQAQPVSGLIRQALFYCPLDTQARHLQRLAQVVPGHSQQLRKRFG
ncbi:hypothetical protein GCM10011321_17190 [Youhaiella tibetensis]|nr:hypothetical protein GCM10011321_17190 [Youhaiella tibetensis]